MRLKRVGVLLVGLGLSLSVVTAVAFGVVWGSTDARCVDHEPTYSIESVDVATLDLTYSDGCNDKSISSAVVGGGVLTVAGLLVGGGGVIREWSTTD